MFQVGQIITPTHLIKKFKRVAAHLVAYPQAVLIYQRGGKHLVLMDAVLFDEMMRRAAGPQKDIPQDTGLQDELNLPY